MNIQEGAFNAKFAHSTLSLPEFRNKTNEKLTEEDEGRCPRAPILKPRNTCFKYNSTKWFIPKTEMVKYTPFFNSEGDESSDEDFLESTLSSQVSCEGTQMVNRT